MGITESGRENFRTIPRNRSLCRKGSIFTHAHDFAGVTVAPCDTFGHVVIGYSHVQHAIAAEVYSCGQMSFGFSPCFGNKNVLNVGELISLQLTAGDRLCRALFSRLIVGEIDEMVLRELWMKDDIHQAAATGSVMHLGHAADRLRVELAVTDETHAAFKFVDEYASVGQE